MAYQIVIIEDDKMLAGLYTNLLTGPGIDIHTFYDGDSALHHIEATPPHLMVLDINLPGLPGLYLLKHARQRLGLGDTKILMATANIMVARSDYNQLVDAILEKPIDAKEFVKVCQDLLNQVTRTS